MIIYPFLEILMELLWAGAGLWCYLKSSPADFNAQPGLIAAGLDCRFFIFVHSYGLNQWSSNLNVHQNHLESLLEHRLLEFLIQQVWGGPKKLHF